MTKQIRIIAAAVLLGSFFIPWFGIFGFGASPFTLVRSNFEEGWLFAVVPILAGIVLFVELKELDEKFWLLFAGLSPFVVSIWILSQFGVFSGGSGMRFSFNDIIGMADFGLFLAIASGAVLIVAFVQSQS